MYIFINLSAGCERKKLYSRWLICDMNIFKVYFMEQRRTLQHRINRRYGLQCNVDLVHTCWRLSVRMRGKYRSVMCQLWTNVMLSFSGLSTVISPLAISNTRFHDVQATLPVKTDLVITQLKTPHTCIGNLSLKTLWIKSVKQQIANCDSFIL